MLKVKNRSTLAKMKAKKTKSELLERPRRNIYKLKSKAKVSLLAATSLTQIKTKTVKLAKKREFHRRRQWSTKHMQMAIELVKVKGFKVSHAANKFSIPLSTLSSYIKEGKEVLGNDSADNLIVSDEDNHSELDSKYENMTQEVKIEIENSSLKESPRVMLMARKSTAPIRTYVENHLKIKELKTIKESNSDLSHLSSTLSFIETLTDFEALNQSLKTKYDSFKEFESKLFSKIIKKKFCLNFQI